QTAGCLLVVLGRRGEYHCVDAGVQHVVERMEEGVPAQGSMDVTGGIGSSHGLDAIHTGPDAHGMTAPRTETDDADSQLPHSAPPLTASMTASCSSAVRSGRM